MENNKKEIKAELDLSILEFKRKIENLQVSIEKLISKSSIIIMFAKAFQEANAATKFMKSIKNIEENELSEILLNFPVFQKIKKMEEIFQEKMIDLFKLNKLSVEKIFEIENHAKQQEEKLAEFNLVEEEYKNKSKNIFNSAEEVFYDIEKFRHSRESCEEIKNVIAYFHIMSKKRKFKNIIKQILNTDI